MKSLPKTNSAVALSILVSCFLAALGCQSMNKQPADPYAGTRIPAPATYSYLGQQPGQPVYNPPGGASTYPPAAVPTPSPLSSEQPASIYGSLGSSGAAVFPTAAASTATPGPQTMTQTIPTAPSSETVARNVDALAASMPIVPNAAPISLDTWSASSVQVVTQVVE